MAAREPLLSRCGNGGPLPEDFVPAQKTVASKATCAKVDGRPGVWTTLRLERGGRLVMHVQHPDPSAEQPALLPLEFPDSDGRVVIGQALPGTPRDLVRVRLVSLDGQRHLDLTWGWAELAYNMAWDRFPMGHPAYQVVPVPAAKYELVLRGARFQELRQAVTLTDGELLKLNLEPKAKVD